MSTEPLGDRRPLRGTDRLPADLTDEELASAPVLDSVDALLIDDLAVAEHDAFVAALT